VARARLFPPAVLDAYATRDIASVSGMLQSGAVSILLSLIELQEAFGVEGNVAEIGVFQGKTFILLALALREGERAAAIEIFGKSPGADRETRAVFEANLARFGCAHASDIIVADSQSLKPADLAARLGRDSVRLFSVDGDHSKAAVLHDLALARATLAPGGVIIADDLFNPWYPTVTEALYAFFADAPGDLEPIALIAANGPVETGAGKLLIARHGYASRYKAGLKLLNQPDLKHCDPFAGFSDVPCFYFAGTPMRHPLDATMRAILKDIAA
jgi:predicted O-methyltransferase YrrM